MKFLTLLLLSISGIFCFAQKTTNVENILPTNDYENIHVKKLYSDSLSSSFVIWVKKGVKSHKHVEHTESIQVLSGEGKMTVDKNSFLIKKGDYFIIPKNTFHSLKVTSKKPIKVVSIQSPEFLGEDRVFE